MFAPDAAGTADSAPGGDATSLRRRASPGAASASPSAPALRSPLEEDDAVPFSPRTEQRLQPKAVRDYWNAVDRAEDDATIPPPKAAWEDGILNRLGLSEGAPRGWHNGQGKPLEEQQEGMWEDGPMFGGPRPVTMGPFPHPINHFIVDETTGEAVLSSGRQPSVLVEELFGEVEERYFEAVRRAILDYHLRSPDPRNHFGLVLHAVDAARFVPAPAKCREDLGIHPAVRPWATLHIARDLRITEAVLGVLQELWYDPQRGYSSLRLCDMDNLAFRHQLPLAITDLDRTVSEMIDETKRTLRGQWHKEAVEAIAEFMLHLRGNGPDDAAASSSPASPGAGTGGAPHQLKPDTSSRYGRAAERWRKLQRLFPQAVDYRRAARALGRWCVWQEEDMAQKEAEIRRQSQLEDRNLQTSDLRRSRPTLKSASGLPPLSSRGSDGMLAEATGFSSGEYDAPGRSLALAVRRDDPLHPLSRQPVENDVPMTTLLRRFAPVRNALGWGEHDALIEDGGADAADALRLFVDSVTAHRLDTTLRAAASLMSRCVQSLTFRGLDDFRQLLSRYDPARTDSTSASRGASEGVTLVSPPAPRRPPPPPPPPCPSSAHKKRRGEKDDGSKRDQNKKGEQGREGAEQEREEQVDPLVAPASALDDVFEGLPPERERTPLLHVTFTLEYGDGSVEDGIPLGKPDTARSARSQAPAPLASSGHDAASAKDGEANEADDTDDDTDGPEPKDVAPQIERRPPIEEVSLEGHPERGSALESLWAGDVSIVVQPSWSALESGLIDICNMFVDSSSDFSRAEVEIRQFTGDKQKLDSMGGGGNATNLTGVSRKDPRVTDTKKQIERIVQAGSRAPEMLRSRFDRFRALFSPAEKERLLRVAYDPSKRAKHYREELNRAEEIMAAIDSTARGLEVFGLVQVNVANLKNILKSRVRLLQNALSLTLKQCMLSMCSALNDRYQYLHTRLHHRPRDSEELVEHAAFIRTIPEELSVMNATLHGPKGAAAMLRMLLLDSLAHEADASKDGFADAWGPPDVRPQDVVRAKVLQQQQQQQQPDGQPGGDAGAAKGRRASLPGSRETIPLGPGQTGIVRDVLQWPDRVREAKSQAEGVLENEKSEQVEQVELAVRDFEEELDQIRNAVEGLSTEGSVQKVSEINRTIATLQKQLEEALDRAETLNHEEELLEMEVTDWTTDIQANLEALGPHQRLWEGVQTFLTYRQSWYHGSLKDLNPEAADRESESSKAVAIRSARELPDGAEGPRSVAQKVREECEKFLHADLPLLQMVANPGLKERHWQEMERIVGRSIPHQRGATLSDMLSVGLEKKIEDIEDTCVQASKEYNLEKALERMEQEWAPLQLELKSHKNTGTHIIAGASVDEIQALLDDHIVKSQTMGASRFAKALHSQIKEWTDTLLEIQNVLDQWVKVQSQWLYLEPIFSSEDIMQQMPEEGRRFRKVDATWRDLMHGAVSDTRALHAMRQERMLERLEEANRLLDLIGKGLNSYLETKRLYFPRFFFLSNDELLEILAETKDPLRVQPHLKKCFEGIKSLEFDDSLNILAMLSDEGERVELTRRDDGSYWNPQDANGNVEVWLDWIEASMRRSVARSIDDAMKAYPTSERTEWVTQWPGQAVLAGSQVFWTHGVEKAIREGGSEGLAQFAQQLSDQINDIIMLVRGELTSLERMTLSALTVLDVHARDVTEFMAAEGISSLVDFAWNSQLRYYWTDDGYSAKTGRPGSLQMRMINAVLDYAGEYLGNSSRLVITPLTDRCYRTLMGAVHLNLGGSPEGPAGTGKTETVKDLAKAGGMMCVVFNCSDQLGVMEMAKFFKGLAASGAWACFDEFNRIDLEVLSVVAQQIMEIQIAKRDQKERFVFYGTDLKFTSTCNVFITMNPGYAGRTELPDNLKALFRTVAMMVPDYALIAEIILYSYGYLDAKGLARKIVATYKLCSEQLSSQSHYDYGMRAVMAVLRAAGNLKRREGERDLPEEMLVLRAIVDVNLPKFLEPDVPLFNGIVQDLFPGVKVPPPNRQLLEGAIRDACTLRGLQCEDVVMEKTLQIYEMMLVRHGFMVVGMPWSGKTTSMRLLGDAMAQLHKEHPDDERWRRVHRIVINPKSVTMAQLYGCVDPTTKEWTNGVLSNKFRQCATGKIGDERDREWIVFDGPVDALWIENMNTVLDDNKKLCLMSGEIIPMSNTMSMVFETKDLAVASPATVSRCGMVYMEPQVLGWQPVVQSWLDYLAEDNPRYPFRTAHPSDPEAKAREERERKAAELAQEQELVGGKRHSDDVHGSHAGAGDGGNGGAGEEEKHEEDQEEAEEEGKEEMSPRSELRARLPRMKVTLDDRRPFTLDRQQRVYIRQLFDWVVDPSLVLLRKDLEEYCPTQDTTLVWGITNLMQASLAQAVQAAEQAGPPGGMGLASEGGAETPPAGKYTIGNTSIPGKKEFTQDDLAATFLSSLVWSIGSTLNYPSRLKFSAFLNEALEEPSSLKTHRLATFFRLKGWDPNQEAPALSSRALIPSSGTVYDHLYAVGDGKWRTWESVLPPDKIEEGTPFADIMVPTVATVQFNHWIPLLLTRDKSVLVCGPTGTGKSMALNRMLQRGLPQSAYLPISIGFSAQTSANQTQEQVDGRLDRRRKGVYGPPPGTKCLVFVDDLNMPEVETYGAQPPLELLRQFADSGGWYDLEDTEFRTLEDTLLLAAMGPPGGGRNPTSPRLMRHFNTLCFTEMGEKTLHRIFHAIMESFLTGSSFAEDVARMARSSVGATLDVFEAASENLRPTPGKSHYTFNLRDFSRVVQGLLLVTPETCESGDAFSRLWMHECLRVFYDRLTTETDRHWLVQQLRSTLEKHFNRQFDSLLSHLPPLREGIVAASTRSDQSDGEGGEQGTTAPATETAAADSASDAAVRDDDARLLFWGDFLNPDASRKPYQEIADARQLVGAVRSSLEDFNGQSRNPMDLVPFLFYLEHVSRIARVLKMPGGHMLLVGVGGSGRTCATRLASFMAGYKVMQVELSKSYGVAEWQEDLKRIMLQAGTGLEPIVFYFTDTQIKWQGMVEDINNLLNSGEVPNLFAADEKAEIYEKVAPLARSAGNGKDLSPAELYSFFLERMRANMHVVLAMSPIGEAFRDRLRKFPSLVNCCTIDWFTSWPADALEAVARKQLHSLELSSTLKTTVAQTCQFFHRSARELGEAFRHEQRRHTYVTPTSFLELLTQFQRSLTEKRQTVSQARQRYMTGLEKLDDAAKQVAALQRQLEDMQPVLGQSQKETEELMTEIQEKLPGVEDMRGKVKEEADIANHEAEKVAAVKAECEADLAEALPALNDAIQALDTLKPEDIKFVRSLTSPAGVIRKVMAAVLVMLGVPPDRVKDPDGGVKKVDDFWSPAKRLLADHKGVLERLKNYDKDNIDPKIIAKIRKDYIDDPEFNVERARSASEAAAGMCAWVRAMDTYERVAKVVAPKRAALKEAEESLQEKQAALDEKQARLDAVEGELNGLQTQYDEATERKEQLEKEMESTREKLIRAEQLIGGLGGEKARWTTEANGLARRYEALTGDVLLSAGIVSYLGPFTIEFRSRCISRWTHECLRLGVPCTAAGQAALVAEAETRKKELGESTPGDAKEGTGGGDGDGDDDDGDDDGKKAEFSLESVMGDPIKIRQWRLNGLPTDSFSTDNAIIVHEARRWPLMIDPQGQANKWIKKTEKDSNLSVLKQTDVNFLRNMENAVQFGQPVVLENVGEELDPSLEPILLRSLFKQGAQWCIRIGDATVEYDEKFRLYITTKMRNPHYLPEVSTRVTLVNFMITPAGLQDQLLGVVVEKERRDLQEEKARLLLQSAENKRMLSDLENRILEVLSTSQGNILDDETAIQILNESKTLSNEIQEKQRVADATERQIDETRAGYSPVASHASRLFFVTTDMGQIDPMYQYSMTWFTNLFELSIRNSRKSDNLAARIKHLNDHFTYSLYKNVCRSLFEKDKIIFSFLLCVKMMSGRGEVDRREWYFLLTGGVAMDNPHPNPCAEWLSEKAWGEIVRLSEMPSFAGLREDLERNGGAWRQWYDEDEPHQAVLPGSWGEEGRLSRFQQLLLLRCFRPDKVVEAVQDFILVHMGEDFLKPPPFDLKGCHEDSSAGQPLVFVLSPGSDPMAGLMSYAESVRVSVSQISLGQGQGRFAEEMIAHGKESGSWVVLQNCHLAVSWMPALEKICEDLAESMAEGSEKTPPHPSFRLWLTSYPSRDFPVSILQNGIKMTNEPPKGLRMNLHRSYVSDPIADPKFFNGVKNAQPFRRMLFGLSFFHAMVQERRQFGSLGWNIPYEFNESDLRISVQQLAMFLDDKDYAPTDSGVTAEKAVPYETLRYLTGECNYGGRVTDDKDRRTLMSILNMFYCEEIHQPEYPLTSSGDWCTPPATVTEYDQYVGFIERLPATAHPEVFGLHANATITKDMNETNAMFSAILETERGGSGAVDEPEGGTKADEEEEEEEEAKEETSKEAAAATKTKDETIAEVAADVKSKVRDLYDLEEIGGRFPVDWAESMNTVLRQELARFNRLLQVIHSSMESVQRALQGLVVMSAQLEEVGEDLYFGRVPELWKSVSYPSLKPLAGYVADLVDRLRFFDRWVEHGSPNLYWLPGFFFTQSFLTGALQNFARRFTVPIDEVAFDVESLADSKDSITTKPDDGVYVYGMYFDGCRWDMSTMSLAESQPKVLFAPAPVMWLKPQRNSDLKEFPHYDCPVYKTSERRGTLSTTGHSTNFVMWLRLPTDQPQDHWIRRGVALLLSLDD